MYSWQKSQLPLTEVNPLLPPSIHWILSIKDLIQGGGVETAPPPPLDIKSFKWNIQFRGGVNPPPLPPHIGCSNEKTAFLS